MKLRSQSPPCSTSNVNTLLCQAERDLAQIVRVVGEDSECTRRGTGPIASPGRPCSCSTCFMKMKHQGVEEVKEEARWKSG